MKNYLVNPKITYKKLSVKNLLDITKIAVNCGVEQNLFANCFKQELDYCFPSQVIKGFCVGNNIFALCSDGWLYSFDGNAVTKQIECDDQEILVRQITINGVNQFVVIKQDGAIVLDQNKTALSITYGNSVCTYNGRMFIAKGNTLLYGNAFDFCEFSVLTDDCGVIAIDQSEGEIIELLVYDNYLLIVCERGFYKLVMAEDTIFTLQKLNTSSVKINKGSVALVGDEVMFISGNQLCSLNKTNVTTIKSIFNQYQLVQNAKVCSSGGKYCIAVISRVDGQNYIFIHDTVNHTECIISQEQLVLCGGEYLVDNLSGKICSINLANSSNMGGKWISKNIDFESNDKKTLHSISLAVNKDALLTLEGDFGSKTYTLKAGEGKKIVNVRSSYFIIKISFDDGQFKSKNLQLEYNL